MSPIPTFHPNTCDTKPLTNEDLPHPKCCATVCKWYILIFIAIHLLLQSASNNYIHQFEWRRFFTSTKKTMYSCTQRTIDQLYTTKFSLCINSKVSQGSLDWVALYVHRRGPLSTSLACVGIEWTFSTAIDGLVEAGLGSGSPWGLHGWRGLISQHGVGDPRPASTVRGVSTKSANKSDTSKVRSQAIGLSASAISSHGLVWDHDRKAIHHDREGAASVTLWHESELMF